MDQSNGTVGGGGDGCAVGGGDIDAVVGVFGFAVENPLAAEDA